MAADALSLRLRCLELAAPPESTRFFDAADQTTAKIVRRAEAFYAFLTAPEPTLEPPPAASPHRGAPRSAHIDFCDIASLAWRRFRHGGV